METTLIAVTLVSLAMAAGMAVVTWRLVQEDRRRSAARVSVLAAGVPMVSRLEEPASVAAIQSATTEVDPELSNGMFAVVERSTSIGRRLAVAGAFAAIVIAGAASVYVASGSSRTAKQTIDKVTASAMSVPLELVSLRHAREGEALTITGLVQNPRDSVERRKARAVAFVFDSAGTFITSGEAGLDFTTLAPGDESPFVIRVTTPGSIGRYRVGFRTEDGRVLPHVDRRQREQP